MWSLRRQKQINNRFHTQNHNVFTTAYILILHLGVEKPRSLHSQAIELAFNYVIEEFWRHVFNGTYLARLIQNILN